MASIFKKIGNFLNRDEVRAGLALGSAAGGFGAFDGMKYGDAIKSTLGGLNLASGLRAGGASGALQAGLGGYGLAQGFGKVGTFGNTYDSLMGNQQAKPNYTMMGPPRNNSAARVKVSALPSLSGVGYKFNAPYLQGVDGQSQVNIMGNIQDKDMGFRNTGGTTMGSGRTDQLYRSTVQNNYGPPPTGMNVTNYPSAPPPRPNNLVSNGGGAMPVGPNYEEQVGTNPNIPDGKNYNMLGAAGTSGADFDDDLAFERAFSGGQRANNNSQGYGFNTGQTTTQKNNTIDALRQNVGPDYGTGNVSAPGFYPNTGSGNDGSFTFKDFSFEKVFDNIVTKAMKDPLQAVAVGSALVTAFADDPKEEAAKAYAAEMARVRAQTDPNSDFGQNYIQSFSDRRTKELDDAYSKATSDFVATMSKRGMMDSTVFTEGKASLDARFAELKAKIPMDSQIALQDYQKAQLSNINLGSQAAYRGGALNAGITNPFSSSFNAAVASTKS